MKKQLEPIKEESYDKKKTKCSKNKNIISTKYTDEYTKFDFKHKGIKKELKNYKTGNESDVYGGFNNFFKVNDKIGVIEQREDKKDRTKNKEFNAIFVSSLLEICGEKTIDTGKQKTGIYVDLAKNVLFDAMEDIFRSRKINFDGISIMQMMINEKFNKLSENEQTVFKCFLFTCLFRTDDFWEDPVIYLENRKIYNFLSNNLMEKKELSFASRWLCKIFLLQMFDRKPENIVVYKDKEGKIDFREIDFDDNKPFKGNDSSISIIFCKLITQTIKLKQFINEKWRDRLQYLKGHYDNFIIKSDLIKASFAEMIKNYTMTPEKIEEVIKKTALKAKYMGLSEQDVIDGINEKIKFWKEMLNDKVNGYIVNGICGIQEAREQTLNALNQITKQDVKNIVNNVMTFHDFTYDKPYFKDDNDILNKDHKKKHEDIATKANEMIKEERIKRKAEKKQIHK